MNTILEVNSLSGGYLQNKVINNISFRVKSADFIGIIGPNGSGKSTLLKLITRVLNPEAGQIFLNKKDIHALSFKEFCRKVAFVSQDTTINFSFSAEEIVLMGRIPHLKRTQFETKHDYEILNQALKVTDTAELKNRAVDQLSAGERQRIFIAKALAQEPILLFLDEPTSHLDIGHQIQILDLLKRLNRQTNLTIIMVLHDLNLASEYCNRIILLNKGEIFKEGSPEEVLTYQNIEAIYKTVVVVNNNPISSKPHVVLVPGEK